ncbi:MAG: hypothetical protein J6A15_01110 [Clostridia bacterium]|nr:hypothetical protein [Clostridia bacterium]
MILSQIQEVKTEISLLKDDYEAAPDDIIKSQVKTFLEKKELYLLDLMERYNGITR